MGRSPVSFGLSPFLIFFNSFAPLSLSPSWALVPGWAGSDGQTASCLHYNAFIYSCVCGQWQPCLCTALLSVCVLRDMTHFPFSLSFCSHHSPFSVKCCFQLASKLTRERTTRISHIQRPTSAHRGCASTSDGRIARVGQIASWPLLGGQHWLSISVRSINSRAAVFVSLISL